MTEQPLQRNRVAALLDIEWKRAHDLVPRSLEAAHAIGSRVPQGIQSSFHGGPLPVYFDRGHGGRVVDLDGNTYVDFHAGSGALVAGHANPAIVAAVNAAAERGMCLAAPQLDSLPVAQELHRRYALPLWRFVNSGSEATMAAVRLARALTGRDVLLKAEGAYHGHHDTVMVSLSPNLDDAGAYDEPNRVPMSEGIPDDTLKLTDNVHYNDPDSINRAFERNPNRVAALIIEIPLCTPTVLEPTSEFLERARSITEEHQALLIVDEVRTGIATATGGGCEIYGVQPDLVTLAKSLGGGLPCGAIGGTEVVMDLVSTGRVPIYGTMNGNPLTMAATRASLTEVFTDATYGHLDRLAQQLRTTTSSIVEEYTLPSHYSAVGPIGCLSFSGLPPHSYRQWKATHDLQLGQLGWLYQINRGVFLSPTPQTRWSLMVPHTADDVTLLADNFAAMASDLRR